jgi:hypothetical protein
MAMASPTARELPRGTISRLKVCDGEVLMSFV